MLRAALCFGAGLLATFGGWRLHAALEQPPGSTTFYRVWSPRLWAGLFAYVLMFLGLMLCCIFTPMFYIARPR